MRTRTSVLAVLFSVGLGAAGAAAQHVGHDHAKNAQAPSAASAEGEVIQLQGEVLDMACFMAHEGKGAKHKQCAQKCLDEGAPVGLLTSDGTAYFLVEDHASKAAFKTLKSSAAERATVTGTLHERGGARAIVVTTVEIKR